MKQLRDALNAKSAWLFAATLICLLGLVLLLFNLAVAREVSFTARLILFSVSSLVVVATLLAANVKIDWRRPKTALRNPQFLSASFLALFAGFGALSDSLDLFSPGPAVETEPLTIERTVLATEKRIASIDDKVDRLGHSLAAGQVARRLAGKWGETEACTVVYEISVDGLGVAIERTMPSSPSFRVLGIIKGERKDTATVNIQKPAELRNRSIDFTIEDAGELSTLIWNDLGTDVPLKLYPC